MKYIIFTDLDGTLLDHYTYSFEKTREAMSLVKKKKIPIVICTSKTQAEIEVYRERMCNEDPFIPENGGAIIIPKGYFTSVPYKEEDRYTIIELGIPYHRIINTLAGIKKTTGFVIKRFSVLTPEEISTATDIGISSARLAKKRFYSEPIIIEGDRETIHEVKQKIFSSGLNFMEGGRFHHIFSPSTDKGKAAKMLINIYKDNLNDSIRTIGLGDSLIDLPMLATVDIPILVKKVSGYYDKRIQLPNLIYADRVGPEGWNKAILKIFKNIISIVLICISLIKPASAEPIPEHKAQYIIDNSTITRIQKPLVIRTDRETLEYFMEHVEELTRHGKDFRKRDLLLEVKGNGRYGIQMPAKHITGKFVLAERKPQKVIYMGHGNAAIFFNFSGSVVLEIDYTTQNDPEGFYEDVKTTVHLKFDNAFLAFLAKAASPILVPKLDKLIAKFAAKTKSVVEKAYANKKAQKK